MSKRVNKVNDQGDKQMSKTKPIIWTISGSDCSGGAGIAADIKTAHGLGVEICHLITANTVQNSATLTAVNPVPVELLQQQFEILLTDKTPEVIKMGLIASVAQVQWLVLTISQLKLINPNLIIVYDPVGQASVGGNLHTLNLEQLTPLFCCIDIVTPNLMEAKTLANLTKDSDLAVLAAKIHHDFDINSVIIKGGHQTYKHENSNECIDYCRHQLNQIRQDNQDKEISTINYQLSSPRLATNYSHGGGCSFATAISSFLAQGYLVRDAFTLAKAFINQGLAASAAVSATQQHQYYGAFEQGGWPTKVKYFPSIIDDGHQASQLKAFPSLTLEDKKLGLYPVINSLYWLKRLLPLGLEIIQLRIKNLPEPEVEQLIIAAINLAKDYNTRLFINDYWQLAIKHGAYGVHIGQEDLVDANLVKIQQAGLRLGISTHGCYEFLLAKQLQPSYLAVGAIFPTKTKDMTGQIQGIDNLTQLLLLNSQTQATKLAKDNNTAIPVVAIGGISLNRAPQVLATGVDSIAVVTAITEAEQPELVVEQLKQLVNATDLR